MRFFCYMLGHSSLSRAVASLTIVLVAYWGYALVAVPIIEPQAARRPRGTPTPAAEPASPRRHQELDALFAPGDWERDDPYVLENGRGKLLIGKYETNRDGTVSISPCTIVMYPEGEFDDEQQRIRQAIVLQASEQAILTFDEPFDIKRGSLGKLVAGALVGPIIIRSDQKHPGPDDDLWIQTRDVQLSADRITTKAAIKFRWGPNYGSGQEMQIDLLPAVDAGKSRGPKVGGIKSFELARDVRLHLVPTGKELRAGVGTANAAASPSGPLGGLGGKRPLLPIEVSCQGPFRFDLAKSVATFRDRVDVHQIQSEGPSDQISGELLAIHFVPKNGRQEGARERGREGGNAPLSSSPPLSLSPSSPLPAQDSKLEPSKLEMSGNPVIVRSLINEVTAHGQRLEYDLATRRVSLLEAADREVVVTRGTDEIRARQIHYQPGEQGRLGRFLAVGAGWLRGSVNEDGNQVVEAQWSRQLSIRPDPDAPQNDVVSLEGAAQARLPGMGGLSADDIYCWLWQRPAAPKAPGAAPEKELAPDRLLARGQVRIDSPQVTGTTEQLEAWFESPPLAVSANALPNTSNSATAGLHTTAPPIANAPGRGGLRSLRAAPGRDPEQCFDVSGKVVRLKLALLAWDPELSELMIDGQAHLEETKAVRNGAKPTRVDGDNLHLVQASPLQATVIVSGQPARVEAGGMTLSGAAVNLNRGENRLWIDGAGVMTMSIDRDMQGKPLAQPQPLEVQWGGRMNFNGQIATFERAVVARSQQQELKTEVLEIVLSQRVDFAERQQGVRPQVAQFLCRGNVEMNGRRFDEKGLASIEQMKTIDLSLNVATGAIVALGPGTMTQVRRGDTGAGLSVPGLDEEPAAPIAAAGDAETISYLKVTFQHSLSGNMNRREMTFGNNVKTLYGPVPTWESVIDPENLGERGIELKCDQMKVREMANSQTDKRFVELEAIGNTDVLGTTFRATAYIMRYSSDKERLVLEGDGRRDAQLIRQLRPGADEATIAARALYYWPRTRRVRIIHARSIQAQGL